MTETSRTPIPLPLSIAVLLVLGEGAVFAIYGVLELLSLSTERVALAVTTSIFFLGYGAGLIACARGLRQRLGWARSPVVFAQLLQLPVAWSFRGGETTAVAVVLALVSVVVLVGIFHPASIRALAEAPNSSA